MTMCRGSFRATRVIVVSDLHLGGVTPTMMSRPELLSSFIDRLPNCVRDTPGEELELVIAGDMVDFLACSPHASWTADIAAARQKFDATASGPRSPFVSVFDALGRYIAAGYRLTVLLGNHDLELGLPQVQAMFLQRIGATAHEVLFVADGRAHRLGCALIEHGNHYDRANANDWAGLQAIASALSREESPSVKLQVSAGSQLVERVVNPIKPKYPFVDLLQPQGELVVLLLLAFEPSLRWEWKKIALLLNGKRLEGMKTDGLRPGTSREVASLLLDRPDPELEQAFGDVLTELRQPQSEVGASDWIGTLVTPESSGLAAILERGESIPPQRLQQIRTVLRRLVLNDDSDRWDGPVGSQGAAAKRLIERGTGTEVVVMGHTHLPRRVPVGSDGIYLNVGTWVDRFRVPEAALVDGHDQELESFLWSLWKDERSPLPPTYGELRVNAEGRVTLAELREVVA